MDSVQQAPEALRKLVIKLGEPKARAALGGLAAQFSPEELERLEGPVFSQPAGRQGSTPGAVSVSIGRDLIKGVTVIGKVVFGHDPSEDERRRLVRYLHQLSPASL